MTSPLPVCHLTIARHMPEPCLGSRCSAWAAGDYRSPDMGSCGLLPRAPEAWQDPALKAADPGLAEAGAMVAEVLDRDACTLEVSTRAHNAAVGGLRCLDAGKWRNPTLRELCEYTRTDLLRLPRCGRVTIAEIQRALAAEGLALREEA